MRFGNINYNQDTFLAQVARGNIEGSEPIAGFGSTTTSIGVTDQLIYPNADYTFSFLDQTTGESVTFVSTDDEDGAGTETGILSITVEYLDVNLEQKQCIVTLNGTTPVTTVTFSDETTGALTGVRFIQCMRVLTVGSELTAVGDIYAYRTGAVTPEDETFSVIRSTDVRCSSSIRMVPKGKALLVSGAVGSSVSTTADAYSVISLFGTE